MAGENGGFAVAVGSGLNELRSRPDGWVETDACLAATRVRNVEYFHDHVRIERMLFDGTTPPRQGILYPDLSRPGMGLELKRSDAEKYRVV
jgi:hypothetical protein